MRYKVVMSHNSSRRKHKSKEFIVKYAHGTVEVRFAEFQVQLHFCTKVSDFQREVSGGQCEHASTTTKTNSHLSKIIQVLEKKFSKEQCIPLFMAAKFVLRSTQLSCDRKTWVISQATKTNN